MKRNIHILPQTIVLLLVLCIIAPELAAQPQFILKRTKREGVPLFFQLYSGFNWIIQPGAELDSRVSDFESNTYGGIMIGLQAAMNIDTIAHKPLWVGVELNYKRIVDRFLASEDDVYYKGYPPAPLGGPPVEYIEQVFSINSSVFVAYDMLYWMQVQAGLGVLYFLPNAELPDSGLPGDVEGLFESAVFPTVFIGTNLSMFTYPHGGINGNIRVMQGLHDLGSLEVQFLLGFMFKF